MLTGLIFIGISLGLLGYYFVQAAQSKAGAYEERYLSIADKQLDLLFALISPEELLRISVLAACGGFVSGCLICLSMPMYLMFVISSIFALLCFFIPRAAVKIMLYRRRNKFSMLFPDGIGIMVNGLKAGLSMMQALEMVAREMPAPLSEEFSIMLKDRKVGKTMDQALNRLVERMPTKDVKIFVMVVKLSQKMGGDVTEAFKRVAETIRNRYAIERKIKALTAETRMQGVVVSCIPFFIAVMFMLVAPEIMKPLVTSMAGVVVLVVILILQAMGGLLMWKLSKIKY